MTADESPVAVPGPFDQGEPVLPTLVLVGPMGAGKSAVGRRVAKALGVPFRDTDSIVVQQHGAIADIFVRDGESVFRAYEHEAVLASLASDGVVALGGGALTHPGTREALVGHRVVLLTVTEQAIAGRIHGRKRPLLNQADGDPLDEWIRIRDERMPVYRSVAAREFDTSSGPMQAVVDRIVAWISEEDSR
ncbi:MAG: shikimate kinase [Microbacterium sp.]